MGNHPTRPQREPRPPPPREARPPPHARAVRAGAGHGAQAARARPPPLPATVDGGAVASHGDLYAAAAADYDAAAVRRLVADRRLAPFYRPVDGPGDLPAAAAAKAPPAAAAVSADAAAPAPRKTASLSSLSAAAAAAAGGPSLAVPVATHPAASLSAPDLAAPDAPAPPPPTASPTAAGPPFLVPLHAAHQPQPDPDAPPLAELYRDPVECPICFLYYPRNINFTRCCDQPICTDCFVQIKRSQTTFEPAECPYCVVPHFGVVYNPVGSIGFRLRYEPDFVPPGSASPALGSAFLDVPSSSGDDGGGSGSEPAEGRPRHSRRRKSVSHTSPSVVTTDDVRPDWQVRARQAAMQRAMNQRRQAVPGRLGPLFGQQEVAGAATAAADLLESLTRFENASSSAERRAFRRAVRESQRDPAFSYLQIMRHMGADIEELMMMEAIRQSLQDSASAGAPSSGPAQPAAASADDSADLDVSHSSDEALISAAISAAVNSAIADHVQAAMPESPRASDGDRPRRDDEEDLTGAPGPSFVRSAAAVADQSSSLSLPRGPGSEPAAAISYDASTPIDARSATLVSAERESQAALAPSIAGVSLESPAPSFSRPLSFTSSSMPIPSDESPAAPEPARSPTTSFAAPSFSSNAPTFDTSSLRTDRYVHVILEHAEPAAPDGGSELTRTNDDSHDTLTQGVRIVAISTRNSEAARRNDADEVVSFDSLAARKSISGDLDSEPLPGSLSVRSHGVLAPAPSPTPSSDVASPVPDVALTAEEV